jgi:hypothetical protein
MPRSSNYRKHSVHAKLNVPELTRAGTSLRLEIYSEEEKIGTLVIGRGSLFWRGGRRQKQIQIDWTRFAQIMDTMAYED